MSRFLPTERSSSTQMRMLLQHHYQHEWVRNNNEYQENLRLKQVQEETQTKKDNSITQLQQNNSLNETPKCCQRQKPDQRDVKISKVLEKNHKKSIKNNTNLISNSQIKFPQNKLDKTNVRKDLKISNNKFSRRIIKRVCSSKKKVLPRNVIQTDRDEKQLNIKDGSKFVKSNLIYNVERQDNSTKMNMLIQNHYQHEWAKTQETYNEDIKIKNKSKRDDKQLIRRLTFKTIDLQEKMLPIVQLKRFQNVAPRVDCGRYYKS